VGVLPCPSQFAKFMSPKFPQRNIPRKAQIRKQNAARARSVRESAKHRQIGAGRTVAKGFDPPEEWHEPQGRKGYQVVVRDAGRGFRHVVTPDQIRERLAQLPSEFIKDLEVVQLSRMTKKKLRFPLYGLQWGCAIYLYPFEEDLQEEFYSPPPRGLVIETKMFGGRWDKPEPYVWRLRWTESAARDFQLNNVLLHELGHLVDHRNTRYMDQERYAEWFAIHYGYLETGGQKRRRVGKARIRRRHHAT